MLLTSDINVSEAAYQTGFKNVSHFSKVFIEEYTKLQNMFLKNLMGFKIVGKKRYFKQPSSNTQKSERKTKHSGLKTKYIPYLWHKLYTTNLLTKIYHLWKTKTISTILVT